MAADPDKPSHPHPGSRAVFPYRAAQMLFADTAACTRFFSRLPVPPVNRLDDPAALPDFRRAARAAPLAGLLVSVPAAAFGLLLGMTALPPLATGLLVVATLAIVTGALHEDGLSDVADGFFGGHTPDRRLEIMKDSRIGAFGAIALILGLGLKAVLIAGLVTRFGAADAMLAVLVTEAVSRSVMVWQWHRLPPARPGGLGARFGQPTGRSAVQSALIGAVCLALLALDLGVWPAALGAGLAVTAAYGTGRLALHKIGGMTGDVLGAVQQLSVLGFFTGVLLLP